MNMRKFFVTSNDSLTILNDLTEADKELKKVSDRISKSALIVTGESLLKIFLEDKLKDEFLNVGS